MFSKFKVENEHLLFKLQKNSCLSGIQIAWDVQKKNALEIVCFYGFYDVTSN